MFENNWESLNSRKVPEWFGKAKFGIFIHWGLYSIPAYAPIKDYAEWYGYACNMENPETDAQKNIKHSMRSIITQDPTMISRMNSRVTALMPTNGQSFLNAPVQNTSTLFQSITTDIAFMKQNMLPGSTQWSVLPREIFLWSLKMRWRAQE